MLIPGGISNTLVAAAGGTELAELMAEKDRGRAIDVNKLTLYPYTLQCKSAY